MPDSPLEPTGVPGVRRPSNGVDKRPQGVPRGNEVDLGGTRLIERAKAVAETAGALSGIYDTAELERLHDDWPD
jgi:hypothetical protein